MTDVVVVYPDLPGHAAGILMARLADLLGAHGITTGREGIDVPERDRRRVLAAIAAARVVVPVWCAAAPLEPVWYADRIAAVGAIVAEAGVIELVIAVRLQPTPPPAGFAGIETFDLAGWDGAFRDPHLQAFIRAIALRLGKPGLVSAATAAELDALPSIGPYPDGPVRTLMGHGEPVSAVAISPDGSAALSGGGRSADGCDVALRMWDVPTGTIVRTFGGQPGTGHTGYVTSIAFAPDGRIAVSAGSDGMIVLWDIATGQVLKRWRGHTRSTVVTTDGSTIVSGGWDGRLSVWDLATGERLHTWPQPQRYIEAVATTPDGARIAVGHGGILPSECIGVSLLDRTNGQTVRTFAHVEAVHCLAISPDGATLLAGGGGVIDGTDFSLRLWDMATGELIRRLSWHQYNVRSVAFSPDGRTALSSGGDKMLVLWDLASGRIRRTYHAPGHPCPTGLVFLPDGRTALSGCDDGTVREWDTTILDRNCC